MKNVIRHKTNYNEKYSTVLTITCLTCLMMMGFKSKSVPSECTEGTSLYDSIVAMDKKWENAYNNCKLDVMEEIISENLEFYHDQNGLLTSKEKLNQAFKNNICGKVTRELKQGSIEVHEIKGYGAVEFGMHGFHNINDSAAPDHYAKFVHIWKRNNGKWQITRVISLH